MLKDVINKIINKNFYSLIITMELSKKFKLAVVLCAIIVFIIMFINIATTDREQFIEEENTEVIVCPDALFAEY
jgi:hypothetical protein